MRLLLKCDLFRMVQDKDKHLTPANRYGATMTIAMYVLLAILLLGEFADYFRGHRQCSLAPASKFANTSFLELLKLRKVHTVVTFPYIPCSRLKAEILSYDSTEPDEVKGAVQVVKYATPLGSYAELPEFPFPYEAGQIDAEEMGCTIKVDSPLPPFPVMFNLIVNQLDRSQGAQTRSDHVIHELRLGGEDVTGLVPQVTKETAEPLSGTIHRNQLPGAAPYFFLFYVQYLRTQVVRPRLPPVSGFQYTSQESLITYNGRGLAPGVYMRLIPSAYSILCTAQYDSIGHFLINLCAVVGGVYTIFSFIELGVETLARYRRQQERAFQNALNTEKAEKQKLVDQYMLTL